MDDCGVEHLKMIQAVISRMTSNSFFLKGWSVSVAAAIYVLLARDGAVVFPVALLYPPLAFWALDAYYLRQERLFRALYDAVRRGTPAVEAFSMDVAPYGPNVPPWSRTLFAGTVASVHAMVFVVVLVLVLVGRR